MNSLFTKGSDPDNFLRNARIQGFSMQQRFVHPIVGLKISYELEEEGFLQDYTELQYTSEFANREMTYASKLHAQLNDAISEVEEVERNHLPLFSVRVFQTGDIGTTIHRNDPSIGPWAVGVTLTGEAPFNTYKHSLLPPSTTLPLLGTAEDPEPDISMIADAGSAWTLYTKYQLIPHSSGIVTSDTQRALLIFYGEQSVTY